MLNVSTIASDREISSAYRTAALSCHPDRYAGQPEHEKKKGEERFKLLQDALDILSDTFKRKLYDEGYCKTAIEDRVAAANEAARRHGTRRGHR